MRVVKLTLIISLLTLISACGRPPTLEIDSQFQPLINQFEKDTDIKIDDLIIKFDDLAELKADGKCTISITGSPTITIDPNFWNKNDATHREEVMYHELGHCILKRKHNNDKDKNDKPVSLMYFSAASLDKDYYIEHRADYLKELMEGNK